MASESVGILIEADDQASAKIQRAADNVDASVKRIRTVGGQAKASTEFIGTLANSLGGSQLGGFAGELGQLTERISAFSEVSKAGGAGALAFKAGAAAAAAVVSFKIGETIGNWAFETERWKNEMAAATKEAERLNGLQQGFDSKRKSEKQEDLSLIRDPEARRAAIEAEAAAADQAAANMDNLIAQSRKNLAEAENRRDAWSLDGTLRRGEHQAEVKMHQEQLENDRAKRASFAKEAQAYREMIGERARDIEAKKAANAAGEKSDSYLAGLREELSILTATKEERFAIEAGKNAFGADAQKEAEALLRQKAAILEKAEAEKKADQEAEQARAKQEAASQRVIDAEHRHTQALEQRRIELEQGKEAARAYALQQEGIAEGAAKRLAAEETALDKLDAKDKETPTLQATQGRLLTRGEGADPSKQIAANTQKLVTQNENMLIKQGELITAIKNSGLTIEVVG